MNELVKTAVTILITLIGSAGFWSYLDARRTKKSASTRLLIGIAHDRITFLGMK